MACLMKKNNIFFVYFWVGLVVGLVSSDPIETRSKRQGVDPYKPRPLEGDLRNCTATPPVRFHFLR